MAGAAWPCRSRMTATGRARSPKSSAAANARTTFFCQIETAEGVENADAIAAIDGVDCLWVGHFDLSVSLGIPGEFEHPEIHRTRSTRVVAATQEAQEGARAAWCRRSSRASRSTRRASISSAIPATSGCCTMRSPRRSASCAPASRQARSRRQTMADKFRVALSGDFRKADGSPAFPDFDLAPLDRRPGVEIAYLAAGEPAPRRAARGFRRADPADPTASRRKRAEERPARRRRPLRRRLRHGRRGGLHREPASRSCITPDGVRRPVAVSIITFMLALTGKLMIKDRLTREGAGRLRQARRAHGRRASSAGRSARSASAISAPRCSAWPSRST